MTTDNINVVIRAKPHLNEKPRFVPWVIDNKNIYQQDEEHTPIGEPYSFDEIFNVDKQNVDIYNRAISPLVHSALEGINVTIFAYGATCSGKTYTMIGTSQDPGVIPRFIENIFEQIGMNSQRKFLLRVSYVEIYGEVINDLLDKNNKDLKVREDVNNCVNYNPKENIIKSSDECMNIMKIGSLNRKTGETQINALSSRSHSIFRIVIESTPVEGSYDDDPVIVSHVNLIDLAGSERVSQTLATGQRFQEAKHINKSLTVLGLVMKQLVEKAEYVNYRDSKLTRILSNSLGGNAKTFIICNINLMSIEDTISTLMFAQRAKAVKNKPKINELVTAETSLTKRYAKECDEFKKMLEVEYEKNKKLVSEQSESSRKISDLLAHIQSLEHFFIKRRPINKKTSKRRHTFCAGLGAIFEDVEPEPLSGTSLGDYQDITVESNVEQSDLFSVGDQNEELIECATPKSSKLTPDHGTPVQNLRERFEALSSEYYALVEFTRLETNSRHSAEQEMIRKIEMVTEECESLAKYKIEADSMIRLLQQQLIQEQEKAEQTNIDNDYLIEIQKSNFEKRENELLEQIRELKMKGSPAVSIVSDDIPILGPQVNTFEMEEMFENNNSLKKQVTELQKSHDLLVKQNTDIMSNFNSCSQNNLELKNSISSLEDEKLQLENEITKLKFELSQMSLAETAKPKKNTEEENEFNLCYTKKLQIQVEELRSELRKVKLELDDSQDKLIEVTEDLDLQEKVNSELTRELKNERELRRLAESKLNEQEIKTGRRISSHSLIEHESKSLDSDVLHSLHKLRLILDPKPPSKKDSKNISTLKTDDEIVDTSYFQEGRAGVLDVKLEAIKSFSSSHLENSVHTEDFMNFFQSFVSETPTTRNFDSDERELLLNKTKALENELNSIKSARSSDFSTILNLQKKLEEYAQPNLSDSEKIDKNDQLLKLKNLIEMKEEKIKKLLEKIRMFESEVDKLSLSLQQKEDLLEQVKNENKVLKEEKQTQTLTIKPEETALVIEDNIDNLCVRGNGSQQQETQVYPLEQLNSKTNLCQTTSKEKLETLRMDLLDNVAITDNLKRELISKEIVIQNLEAEIVELKNQQVEYLTTTVTDDGNKYEQKELLRTLASSLEENIEDTTSHKTEVKFQLQRNHEQFEDPEKDDMIETNFQEEAEMNLDTIHGLRSELESKQELMNVMEKKISSLQTEQQNNTELIASNEEKIDILLDQIQDLKIEEEILNTIFKEKDEFIRDITFERENLKQLTTNATVEINQKSTEETPQTNAGLTQNRIISELSSETQDTYIHTEIILSLKAELELKNNVIQCMEEEITELKNNETKYLSLEKKQLFIEEIITEKNSLKGENNDLRKELDLAQKKVKNFEDRINALTQDYNAQIKEQKLINDNLNRDLESREPLQSEVTDRLQSELKTKEDFIKTMVAQCDKHREDLLIYKDKIRSLSNQINVEREMSDLLKEKEELLDQRTREKITLEQENIHLTEKLKQGGDELKLMLENIETLRNRMNSLDEENNSKGKSLDEQREINADLNRHLEEFKTEQEALKKENAEIVMKLKATVEKLRNELEIKEESLKAMSGEIEKQRHVHLMDVKNIGNLSDQIEKLKADIEIKSISIQEQVVSFDKINTEIKNLEDENISLNEKLKQTESELQLTIEAVKNLEFTISLLREDLEKAKICEMNLKKQNEEIKTNLTNDLELKEKSNKSLEAEIEKLMKNNLEDKEKIETLLDEIKHIRMELASSSISLQEKTAFLEKMFSDKEILEKHNNCLTKITEEKEKDLQLLRHNNQDLLAKLEFYSNENGLLKLELNELKKTNATFSKNCEAFEKRQKILEDENRELIIKLDDVPKTNDLISELQLNQNLVKQLETENLKCKEEHSLKYKKLANETEKKIKYLSDEVALLKTENNNISSSLKQRNILFDRTTAEMSRLNEENSRLKAQVQDLHQHSGSKEAEEHLQQQIYRLRDLINPLVSVDTVQDALIFRRVAKKGNQLKYLVDKVSCLIQERNVLKQQNETGYECIKKINDDLTMEVKVLNKKLEYLHNDYEKLKKERTVCNNCLQIRKDADLLRSQLRKLEVLHEDDALKIENLAFENQNLIDKLSQLRRKDTCDTLGDNLAHSEVYNWNLQSLEKNTDISKQSSYNYSHHSNEEHNSSIGSGDSSKKEDKWKIQRSKMHDSRRTIDLHTLNSEIVGDLSNCEDSSGKIRKMALELNHFKKNTAHLQSEMEKLKIKYDALKKLCRIRNEEIQKLKQNI